MKKLTLDEWEEKYITGPVERFDQKNQMFSRRRWDSTIMGQLEDWSIMGRPKQKPGFDLQDYALHWASQRGTQLALFNSSKPNPSRATRAIMAAMASNPQHMARDLRAEARIDVRDPHKITRDVKKVATYFGADLVGICKLDRRWIYSHTWEGVNPFAPSDSDNVTESEPQEIPEEFRYAVVMAFEKDYDLLRYFPSAVAVATTYLGYSRMAFTNTLLSSFIRGMGFKAIDCSTNDVALSIPMAMQAGLGDLGRHGLLITPRFGPRVRLSKVITNLPLVADSPIDFGVTEFCTACKKCADMCPSRSIMSGERTAEPRNLSNAAGSLKWPINAETCRIYWSRFGHACTTCLACCPYNKPYTPPHRLVRWFTEHVRWADAFYVKMDNLLGYGQPRRAARFWEEWQPKRG